MGTKVQKMAAFSASVVYSLMFKTLGKQTLNTAEGGFGSLRSFLRLNRDEARNSNENQCSKKIEVTLGKIQRPFPPRSYFHL